MSEFNSRNKDAFSGVMVVCETDDNGLHSSSLEMVSEGRRLADELHAELHAVILGRDVEKFARELGGHGADKVIVCQSDWLSEYRVETYTKVICELVEEHLPNVMLIAATSRGRELAPRCAARLKTGLCADCTGLHIDNENYLEFVRSVAGCEVRGLTDNLNAKELKMSMPAFGGELMETIICPELRPQMATVRPGIAVCNEFSEELANACTVEKVNVQLREDDIKTLIKERIHSAVSAVDITAAHAIVAVGRGIESDAETGLKLAQELAAVLGAEIAASRDAVNAGWVSPDRLVGQTGKVVRPELYIALGISGAIQHKIGMQDSGTVIAVNTDKNAAIFEVADYALVGDLFELVPLLIEAFREKKD